MLTQPRKRLRQTFYSQQSRTVVPNCSVRPHSNAKPRRFPDAACHTVRATRRDIAHPATQTFETNVLLSPESNSCPQLFRQATFKRQAASHPRRNVSHRSLNASRHCAPSHANVWDKRSPLNRVEQLSPTVPSGHTQTPSRGKSQTQRVTPFAQRVAALRAQPRKRLRQTFYSHQSRTVVLNCSVRPHSNAKPRQIPDATCHTVRTTRRDVARPATQTFETNVLLSPE
ncbi:hypothetical protein RISK_006298 [Rhodopirellula islandica]|uniref:Uncharacterized protein n=1 Tax=Rhodopirellula islandica TaxID=595434 RepID=A0A0J1B4X4_RHOIS|nr:hypothetical protein RISK_006298 [Rhodopirellula islandica]